jgi:hypothetical protein
MGEDESFDEGLDTDIDYDVYVDGGLWANNPILVALTEALSMAENEQPIEILSVGTCPPPSGESPDKTNLNWGSSDWEYGRKALSVSMDSQSIGYDFIAKLLSEQLSKCTNRNVSILRLDQAPPPADYVKHLVLDRADPDTQRVLIQMGTSDGLTAYSKALSETEPSYNWIKEALSELPLSETKTHAHNGQ